MAKQRTINITTVGSTQKTVAKDLARVQRHIDSLRSHRFAA